MGEDSKARLTCSSALAEGKSSQTDLGDVVYRSRLAMSTWNDVAVTFWQQVYVDSGQQYEAWRKSSYGEHMPMTNDICTADVVLCLRAATL